MQLNAAQATIAKLIGQLEQEREARQAAPIGICPYCKQPIAVGDSVVRDMHETCYADARQLVLQGKKTWEQLVAEGLAGEAKKGGRPRKRGSKKKSLQ